MKNETYNGWANWDTWNANLRLTNDQFTYSLVVGQTPEFIKSVWFGQFAVDGLNSNNINFDEIAEGLSE